MKKKIIIIGILLVIALFTVGIILYKHFNPMGDRNINSEEMKYEKHYVLISKDITTTFWQSVYRSAKKEARKNHIYLEQVGSNLSEEYSLEDYLRISIASKVDGIIINPDGSKGVTKLIKEATDKGIPVITILHDESDSKRVSFVGINSYELGLVYGKQIQKKKPKIYIFYFIQQNRILPMMWFLIKLRRL
jgi:ribose transport system substrate-binding protein